MQPSPALIQTWDVLIPEYTKYMQAAERSPRTIELRLYQMRRLHKFTGLQPHQVTKDDLRDYMSNPAWKANTKQVVRASLVGFFAFCFREEFLPTDPSVSLPSIRGSKGKPKPASDEDVASALAKASPRVTKMIQLGIFVGLRAMEIASVHTDNVVLTDKGATLRVFGKGAKTRILPISDEIAELFIYREPGYLFPGRIDGHVSPAYVSRLVSRALPPGVTCHKLRHRFATRAYRNSGHNLRALQIALGHASIATTEIYTSIDNDELRSTMLSAA